MMSRLRDNLIGLNGEYWKKDAEKFCEDVVFEWLEKEITIDDNGVVRNCIGRIAVEEVVEALALMIGEDKVNIENTNKAREKENAEFFAEYRRQMENYEPSEEEMFEMECAFGKGTVVVDVITGKKIRL